MDVRVLGVRVRGLVSGLLLFRQLREIALKAVVELDHDVYVALSVDVRVVAVGALKEHLVVLGGIGRPSNLKRVLDRVVRCARLRDRALVRPSLKL